MVKPFSLLLCTAGAGWLVYTFGFGMLLALAALIAGAVLLFVEAPAQPMVHRNGPPTCSQTTGWRDF
ncbi:hypothetical protein GCM10023165_13830 [Variovorax defluvii]|uniref:Uncharacterized protein n=1 Tax=Variovorax defluvii TaxID=913761 RepID=A0ABP8HAD2_9BURK